MAETYDVVIVGSGMAGLTAAVYAARYNLKTLVIGNGYGLLAEAHKVENWPGIKSIPGVELVQKMIDQVKWLGAEYLMDEITGLKRNKEGFEVFTKAEKIFKAKTLILSMGLTHRKLNLPGEKKLLGKGVSYCATCDAPFTKGKVTGVVGGSDSAAQAALLVSEYAEKVIIFYRRDKLRAEPIYVKQIEANPKIETMFKTNVVGVEGSGKLEKVLLDVGGKKQEMPLGFLIIEIGAVPQTVLLQNIKVDVNQWGFIECDRQQNTNVEGVYACGDINSNNPLRQAITASAEGAIAANSAYEYLKKKASPEKEKKA